MLSRMFAKHRTASRLSVVVAAALSTLPAFAQDAASPAPEASAPATSAPAAGGDSDTSDPSQGAASVSADAEAGAFPLHISGSLSHFLGQGTFVSGAAGNPYVASSLALTPSAVWAGFRFGVVQSFDLEYTQSDSTSYPNQIMWSDTGLSVAYGELGFPDLGISFLLTGGASLPISLASRQQGRLTGLSAGGQVNWTYEPWALSLFTGASLNYNVIVSALAARSALQDVRPYEDRGFGTLTPSSCVRRAAEELGNYACSVIPSLGGYNVRAGAGWSTLDGQLSFNSTVALLQQFSAYFGPDDQYTPPNAQKGLQQRDVFTTGVISASYVPVSWFALTVGTQTFQPLYTSTRKGVRVFPFWDFTSAANNYSSVFVDTTFTY